jgi:hypothetical protein
MFLLRQLYASASPPLIHITSTTNGNAANFDAKRETFQSLKNHNCDEKTFHFPVDPEMTPTRAEQLVVVILPSSHIME